LPVLTFLGGAPALATEAPADCGNGAVFVVAGTGDPDFLHTRGVEARYIARGYVVKRVDYPATFWPLGAQSYDANIGIGQAVLTDDVATYQSDCPGKPAVITGYSQGARVAGDVLADIAAGKADGVSADGVSGELYADPRRRGTSAGAGAEVNLINAYPGAMLDGSRDGDFGDLTVYSICIDGDAVCDVPDPRRDPIGALDALLGFWVKHFSYGDIMSVGPEASVGGEGVTVVEGSDGATAILVGADPSLTTVLAQVGLPNLLRPVILDFPRLEPAVIQPISRAIMGLLPALPQLGHGAYLTDLYAIRDALSGDPAAWSAIFGSAVSVVRYPVNFVRDWVAVIDAVLDRRDPDLGFIAAPTVRTVATAVFGAVVRAGTEPADPAATPASVDDSPKVLAAAPVEQSPTVDHPQGPAAVVPEPGRHRAPEGPASPMADGFATTPGWNQVPDTSEPGLPADPGRAGSAGDQTPDTPAPVAVETPAATEATPIDMPADPAVTP